VRPEKVGEHDQGGVTGDVQQGVGAPRSCSKPMSPETEAEPLWLQVPAWASSEEQPTPGGGGHSGASGAVGSEPGDQRAEGLGQLDRISAKADRHGVPGDDHVAGREQNDVGEGLGVEDHRRRSRHHHRSGVRSVRATRARVGPSGSTSPSGAGGRTAPLGRHRRLLDRLDQMSHSPREIAALPTYPTRVQWTPTHRARRDALVRRLFGLALAEQPGPAPAERRAS